MSKLGLETAYNNTVTPETERLDELIKLAKEINAELKKIHSHWGDIMERCKDANRS